MSEYSEWKGWGAAEFGQCPAATERYFDWHVDRALATSRPAGARVLELGFGNGRFLGYCRKRGFGAVGVESDPDLVERASGLGFVAAKSIDDLVDHGPFDLIAAFDVLEHLDRQALDNFFGKLPPLLGDAGRVLLRVPNGDSPFGRRHQHGDRSHITTFGEFKLRQFAHASGLTVAAVGDSPWYVDEFDALGLKMAVRGVVRTILDYVLSMAYYREPVDLGPNLVVVLKKA
jgi:SAM-dependent methyltransferase